MRLLFIALFAFILSKSVEAQEIDTLKTGYLEKRDSASIYLERSSKNLNNYIRQKNSGQFCFIAGGALLGLSSVLSNPAKGIVGVLGGGLGLYGSIATISAESNLKEMRNNLRRSSVTLALSVNF